MIWTVLGKFCLCLPGCQVCIRLELVGDDSVLLDYLQQCILQGGCKYASVSIAHPQCVRVNVLLVYVSGFCWSGFLTFESQWVFLVSLEFGCDHCNLLLGCSTVVELACCAKHALSCNKIIPTIVCSKVCWHQLFWRNATIITNPLE